MIVKIEYEEGIRSKFLRDATSVISATSKLYLKHVTHFLFKELPERNKKIRHLSLQFIERMTLL